MSREQRVLSLPVLLGVLFIAFKLTHLIDWPWLWVLSPLWAPFAVLVLVVLAAMPFVLYKTFRKGEQ